MSQSRRQEIFERDRKRLVAAGLTTTVDDALICPLCWKEKGYEELSLEHMVPGCVGGKKKNILTCERNCNNKHGSALDSHLGHYLNAADALRGHGPLATKLNVNGNLVTANLVWGKDTKDIRIVGKASRKEAWEAIRDDMEAGKVSEMKLTVNLKYSMNRFRRAVLRAAYLVLFKCFGYEYAKHEVVQVIRRRICDPSLKHPRLETLVVWLRDCTLPLDEQHLVVPGDVNGVGFFLVIIRVRGKTTSHVGAYLPVPGARSEEFFDLMEQVASEHNGETVTIPPTTIFT